MNLPEHGTATDATAQLAGNLPGCHAFQPLCFQIRDARVRPTQGCTSARVPREFGQSIHQHFPSAGIRKFPTTIAHDS
jgi:hypothetical protein